MSRSLQVEQIYYCVVANPRHKPYIHVNKTKKVLNNAILQNIVYINIIPSVAFWVHGELYSIQHLVIKFVSHFRRVGGFLRFPPARKLTATI
jgi:hypothetical protein